MPEHPAHPAQGAAAAVAGGHHRHTEHQQQSGSAGAPSCCLDCCAFCLLAASPDWATTLPLVAAAAATQPAPDVPTGGDKATVQASTWATPLLPGVAFNNCLLPIDDDDDDDETEALAPPAEAIAPLPQPSYEEHDLDCRCASCYFLGPLSDNEGASSSYGEDGCDAGSVTATTASTATLAPSMAVSAPLPAFLPQPQLLSFPSFESPSPAFGGFGLYPPPFPPSLVSTTSMGLPLPFGL